MNNYINKQKSIKEKADFIYLNSGLILSKLQNDFTKIDTENCLQTFLLNDTKSNEEEILKYSLLTKCSKIEYENNYQSAIQIIFYLANIINKSDFFEDGKIRLIDKLRKYTKYFACDKKDEIENKKYIHLHEKN